MLSEIYDADNVVSSSLTNAVILWFAWLENNYEEDNVTDLAFKWLSKASI